ncbi:MAG TPA: phosphatase PAP2 family protein, partial [Candidatus Binatia bacterium]|nr:phosphatase PAP2 family protein [Candidatus Binatia bacterium]
MSAVPVRRGPGASPPVEARGETRVVLSLLVGTAALGAVFGLAAALPDLGWWDAWTLAYFTGLRACRAGDGVRTFTNAAPYLAALLAGTSVATAVVKGRRAEGVGVLVLLALALLLVQALKFLFERNRPGLPPWVDAADQSFPSGHVANAAICVAAALRLGPPFGGPTLRRIATPLALTFVLAVGWSRLWLERHWLTDVAAGLLLG